MLQCILSIFPASVHQFYANLLVFVNVNPFLYIIDQFALKNIPRLRKNKCIFAFDTFILIFRLIKTI